MLCDDINFGIFFVCKVVYPAYEDFNFCHIFLDF